MCTNVPRVSDVPVVINTAIGLCPSNQKILVTAIFFSSNEAKKCVMND